MVVKMVIAMRKTERDRDVEWQTAIEEAWQRHGLGTYGQAEQKTGMERTVLFRWRSKGEKPTAGSGRGSVIDWAVGIGEDINHWLELAGYDPIPEELVCERPDPMMVREQMAEYLVQTNRLTPKEAEAALSELQTESEADPEEWRDLKSA